MLRKLARRSITRDSVGPEPSFASGRPRSHKGAQVDAEVALQTFEQLDAVPTRHSVFSTEEPVCAIGQTTAGLLVSEHEDVMENGFYWAFQASGLERLGLQGNVRRPLMMAFRCRQAR
jgi:hypothetical protein